MPRNIAKLADPPRPKGAEMKTWDAEQLRAFLEAVAPERLYGAYYLAATTGARRGEILGLREGDVDLEARALEIRQTLIAVGYDVTFSEPKTAKGRRRIDLDEGTVAVLKAHRARRLEERVALGLGKPGPGDLMFSQPGGEPVHPQNFTDRFDRLVKRSGLSRIRLHDLRHTYATLALKVGVSPKVVSERLGHANISITLDTYSHVLPGMQREAAETVARLIFG